MYGLDDDLREATAMIIKLERSRSALLKMLEKVTDRLERCAPDESGRIGAPDVALIRKATVLIQKQKESVDTL